MEWGGGGWGSRGLEPGTHPESGLRAPDGSAAAQSRRGCPLFPTVSPGPACMNGRGRLGANRLVPPTSRGAWAGRSLVGGGWRAKSETEGEDSHQSPAQAFSPPPFSLLISQKEGCVLPQRLADTHHLGTGRLLATLGILHRSSWAGGSGKGVCVVVFALRLFATISPRHLCKWIPRFSWLLGETLCPQVSYLQSLQGEKREARAGCGVPDGQ